MIFDWNSVPAPSITSRNTQAMIVAPMTNRPILK